MAEQPKIPETVESDMKAAFDEVARSRRPPVPIVSHGPKDARPWDARGSASTSIEIASSPAAPNPFAALASASNEVTALHDRLVALAGQLAGPLPAFDAIALPSAEEGLLAHAAAVARAVTSRAQHCGQLLDRVEAHLK